MHRGHGAGYPGHVARARGAEIAALDRGKISSRLRKVYDVVRQAQEAAIEAIRPGKTCEEVDAVARGIIEDAGFGKQLLLSHDRGWYDPSQPGAKPQHFTYLSKVFLPKLSAAGVDDATIRQLTVENPFNAFAR